MKTESSSRAQYFRGAQNGGFLPEKVSSPSGDDWFGLGRHTVHINKLDPARGQGPAKVSQRSEVQRTLDTVARNARMRHGDEATVVFVAETVSHSSQTQWAWDEFSTRFDEVTFVLSVRRQDEAISSLITQRVKSPASPYWSLSLAETLVDEPQILSIYDFDEQVARFSPNNPGQELKVLPIFERDADRYRTISNFFNLVDLGSPTAFPEFEKQVINRSPSRDYMLKISRVKRDFAISSSDTGLKVNNLPEVVALRAQSKADQSSPSWKLEDAERRDILRSYADSNARLVSRYLSDPVLGSEWSLWSTALAEATQQLESAG
jgi:hypothetical protein